MLSSIAERKRGQFSKSIPLLVALFFCFLFLTACSPKTECVRTETIEVIKYVDNNRTIIIQDPNYCINILQQAKVIKQEANRP